MFKTLLLLLAILIRLGNGNLINQLGNGVDRHNQNKIRRKNNNRSRAEPVAIGINRLQYLKWMLENNVPITNDNMWVQNLVTDTKTKSKAQPKRPQTHSRLNRYKKIMGNI